MATCTNNFYRSSAESTYSNLHSFTNFIFNKSFQAPLQVLLTDAACNDHKKNNKGEITTASLSHCAPHTSQQDKSKI